MVREENVTHSNCKGLQPACMEIYANCLIRKTSNEIFTTEIIPVALLVF